MLVVNQLCGQMCLGKQGENLARIVYFDEPDIWKKEFGEGVCELLHQRNGDTAPYPVKLEVENGKVCWKITNADTAMVGDGKCELQYIVNDVVIKSKIWTTTVLETLSGDLAEPPEPQQAWVDEVLGAASEVKSATVHPPIIGENENWWLWDFEASEYVDSGVKATDEDRIKEITDPIKEDVTKINNTLNQHIEESIIYNTASSNTAINDVDIDSSELKGIKEVNFYGFTSQETGATLLSPKTLKYYHNINGIWCCDVRVTNFPGRANHPLLATNNYRDSGWVDLTNDKIHYKRIVKKIVLDGTEGTKVWKKSSNREGRYYANLHLIDGLFTDEDLSRINSGISIAYEDGKCTIADNYSDDIVCENGQFNFRQGVTSTGYFRFEFFSTEVSTLDEVIEAVQKNPITLFIPMIYEVYDEEFDCNTFSNLIKRYGKNPFELYVYNYNHGEIYPTEVTYQLDVGLAIQNLKNAVNVSQGGE